MFKHPKGLSILFFTEMWERFSYYGMRAILVLFLVSETNGGLGWAEGKALTLYGWYTMLVYVMSIPGGILADRVLGQKRAVILGGALLVVGHTLMAFTFLWAFYAALVLIVLGVGFLKPNISTLVGGLYKDGDRRRDSGFIIFYMGINIGALSASIIVGYIGEKIGWHYGFALAGIGMLIGQLIFITGQKHLAQVGNSIKNQKSAKIREPVLKFTSNELDRLKVIFISFLIVLAFWAAFEQAGGLMNLYTKQYTDRFFTREVKINEYQTSGIAFEDSVSIYETKKIIDKKGDFEVNNARPFFINLFNPSLLSFENINDSINQKIMVIDQQAEIALSNHIVTRQFTSKKESIDSLVYQSATSESSRIIKKDDSYIIYDLSNEQTGVIVPASIFQSLNPIFIVIFGGIFSALWIFLSKRNKEPNTMTKFGLSTIILGIGFLWMVFATLERGSSDLGKSSISWIFLAYLFHTLGELCISPIALSFITKVAPKKIVASMMGIYFAVTGLGNFAAALIGKQAEKLGELVVFGGIFAFSVIIGVILILFAKRINSLTHGIEN